MASEFGLSSEVLGVVASESHAIEHLTSHGANILELEGGVIHNGHLADTHMIILVGNNSPRAIIVRREPHGLAGAFLGGGVIGVVKLDTVHLIVACTTDQQMGGGNSVGVISLRHALVNRQVALVGVNMTRKVHVNTILVE